MMEFEIADILFLIKSLKYPSTHFDITHFISFSSSNTHSSAFKIQHKRTKSNVQGHFHLNHIPRLWNSLPSLDLNLSTSTVNSKLRQFFWNHFISNFDSHNPCTFHYLCPCLNGSKLPITLHLNFLCELIFVVVVVVVFFFVCLFVCLFFVCLFLFLCSAADSMPPDPQYRFIFA